MNIIIINGSARNGNTLSAVNAFMEGGKEQHTFEVIQPDQLTMDYCKGCGVCACYKGCIDTDDTNETVDRIVAADMIIFATPVYWWGVSAQLKLVIDKLYCRGAQLKGKKIGVIVVGGASVESVQYELIKTQFDCMSTYLNWDMLFYKAYQATNVDDLKKNTTAMEELTALGKSIEVQK